MKFKVAFLALAIAVLSPAAEDSPFYLPIRNNDLAALRHLIVDPGPKVLDARGNSPLMYAAALGSPESMRLLLDAGADPNIANQSGATPLMWCAGDPVKVRLLLAKGANVNASSKLGRTPLLIAAAHDGTIETARLFIEKGADVNAADKGGISVLQQAAGSNNVELARLLIAKGAEVNTVDVGGFTPLTIAAGNGERNTALVKLLLEHGAPVNVKSGDTVEMVKNGPIALGRLTPLHVAASVANYETVEALLKAGADVNAKDIRNATPLVFAVTTDRPNVRLVQLLLSKGAAPEPALAWVRRYQDPAILPLFGLKPSHTETASTNAESRRGARDAVAKALASSQPVASKFVLTGGCVSCHAQNFNGMAVSAAKAVGFKPDDALANGDARAAAAMSVALQEQLFQLQDPPPGVDGMEFAALHLAAAGAPATLATDSLVHYIAATQRKEGDWPSYGGGRPPLEDGGFNQAARGIRVLRQYAFPGRKAEFEERIARAASWLEKNEPVTTEDRSTQILGLSWGGHKVMANRVKELVAKQRADGGWGQTDNLPTDAYATGEALWALHESRMPSSDPVYRRGVDYLLRTQQEDGTWHVVTRAFSFQPYFESGFPYGHDQWISEAGTALATIALTFAAN